MTRELIAWYALADPYPTIMLSLCGHELATEKLMVEKGVKIKSIIGIERDEDLFAECCATLDETPELKGKMRILHEDAAAYLARVAKERLMINNYWLDFMGILSYDTINPIEILICSPALKHSIDRFGKVRVQFVVKALDQYKNQDETLRESFAKLNNKYRGLSTAPPVGKDRLKLNTYYNMSYGVHYYFASMLALRGIQTKNIQSVFYKDGTEMLFFAMELTYPDSLEIPQVLPPEEPVFYGMGQLTSPRTEAWLAENHAKGLGVEPPETPAQRRTRLREWVTQEEKNRVLALPKKIRGNLALFKKTKVAKSTKVEGENKPVGPTIHKVVQILAQEPRLQQDILRDRLLKKMPESERGWWYSPEKKGCPPIENHIAWAKVKLRKGGYAHPKPAKGKDDGIRLTPKGIRMAKKLPKYYDRFVADLEKGHL